MSHIGHIGSAQGISGLSVGITGHIRSYMCHIGTEHGQWVVRGSYCVILGQNMVNGLSVGIRGSHCVILGQNMVNGLSVGIRGSHCVILGQNMVNGLSVGIRGSYWGRHRVNGHNKV